MIVVLYDVENLRERRNYIKAVKKVKEVSEGRQCIQFAYADWGRFSNENKSVFIKSFQKPHSLRRG